MQTSTTIGLAHHAIVLRLHNNGRYRSEADTAEIYESTRPSHPKRKSLPILRGNAAPRPAASSPTLSRSNRKSHDWHRTSIS